jgi:hypothetical protein
LGQNAVVETPPGEFDWSRVHLARGTRLSVFDPHAEQLSRGLFRVAAGVYALANPVLGGTVDDPGVGAVLWAMSEPIATLVYDRVMPDEYRSEFGPPPEDVVGFSPLNFGAVLTYERDRGNLPQLSATYRFPDGAFASSEVRSSQREYIFRSANPSADEPPIAIRFNLGAT